MEICAEQWRSSVTAAREGLRAIPGGRQITIHYDALVGGVDALREVANFCDLVSIDDVLQAHRTRVIDTADDKWRSALTAEQKARIEPIVEPLLRELGYLGGGAA